MGKIFVRKDSGFVPLDETKYSQEDQFQEFLFLNPEVMGIVNDDGIMIKMVPIAREVPVPDDAGNNFYIDLLCLDEEGLVNIIEVKRCCDSRIRREVIGQIFDYASNLCYSSDVSTLHNYYLQSLSGGVGGVDQSPLYNTLETEEYWEKVRVNLQAGKIRLIITADGIPENLKRIIEFLNKQMNPAELIGIDLRKFGHEDYEVYTSTVIGSTEESKAKKGTVQAKKNWDIESFLKDIEEQTSPRAREIAQRMIDWCNSHNVRITLGGGLYEGSIIPVYDKGANNNILFAVYGRGKFYLQFQWLRPPFDNEEWKMKLMNEFNEVWPIPLTMDDMKRRPSIMITDLDDEGWTRLLGMFERFIKYIDENQ